MIALRPADFADPQLAAMLTLHTTRARAKTAHGSAHALDLAALMTPDIALWTAWEDETLLAVGALRRLDAAHGELKSMFTADHARRRGAGRAILTHLIAEARRAGLARVSLETGAWAYFEPARAFYRAHGFTDCEPFGDYRPDPHSVFLTIAL